MITSKESFLTIWSAESHLPNKDQLNFSRTQLINLCFLVW